LNHTLFLKSLTTTPSPGQLLLLGGRNATMKRAHSPLSGGSDGSKRHSPLGSIYASDTTRHKRLFRSKNTPEPPFWQPGGTQPEMSPLTDYILKNEEAFQSSRVFSLYADQQVALNPDGYHFNVSAWIKALSDATRAGIIRSQGASHDLLHLRCSKELLDELEHPQYGTPACLPAVFKEALQHKEMMTLNHFLYSKTSIYSTSWLPSPWKIMQWTLRKTGVLSPEPDIATKLPTEDFVIIKSVEHAASQILKSMKESTSTTDRVLSKADFMKRFAHVLNPSCALTAQDLEILLVHLSRDKQAIHYNASTIKFKLEHENRPQPITQEDEALVKLHDALASVNAQIEPLVEKITLADAAAREAVAAKNMTRAKAALRSKKQAEQALEHHTNLTIQLEGTIHNLRTAADQVGIVEAMRVGANAMKSLNAKMGGAEGVQGVVDEINEQMALTDEISSMIGENTHADDLDIDDEFEALENAEKLRKEKETAAKLASLGPADRKLGELQAVEDARAVEKASESFSNLSFVQRDSEDEEMEDAREERVLVPA